MVFSSFLGRKEAKELQTVLLLRLTDERQGTRSTFLERKVEPKNFNRELLLRLTDVQCVIINNFIM
jgi:hypothetical protein